MNIIKKLQSRPTQDGDGVKISRIADFSGIHLDPYLMIDELRSDDAKDFIGGFPPHPHRGIETFTYMIKGAFEHQDQMGNKKHIRAGDVQWMSTGSGVIHSEMPAADEEHGMHGFQIWLNMPAKDKMRPAIYQDSAEAGSPVINDQQGVILKALAGSWQFANQHVASPLDGLATGAAVADMTFDANKDATLNLQQFEQVLIYVHTGSLSTPPLARGELVIVDSQSIIEMTSSQVGAGILVLTGNKIKESIVHMGPFVMNTQAEINQAVQDYQTGKFGQLTI